MKEKRFVTDYFPENIVRDGVGGCCHDAAVALHRRTGWPIAVLWRDPSNHPNSLITNPLALHVYCMAPDGRAVDVEGARSVEALIPLYDPHSAYRDRLRHEVIGDEKAWAAVAEANYEIQQMAPKEHRVEAAEKVLWASQAFLDLIEELSGIPTLKS